MNITFNQAISISFVGRFLAQIQIAVLGLAAASLLSKQDFGLFQQLLSFSLIAVAFARLGFEIIAQLEISQKNGIEVIDLLSIDLIKIKIIGSLVVFPVLVVLLQFFSFSDIGNQDTLLIASYTFLLAVNRYVIDAVMVYSLRIGRSIIITNALACAKLCVVVYLIFIESNSIQPIISALLFAESVCFIYLILFYNVFNKDFLSLNFQSLSQENIKSAWHQYGDVLLSTMVSMAGGVLVLSLFEDLELLASYTFILAVVLGVFSGSSLNSMLEPIINTLLLRRLNQNSYDFEQAEIDQILAAWCSLSFITNLFIGLCLFIFMNTINEHFLDYKYSSEVPKIFMTYIGLSAFCWTYQYSTWALLKKRLDILRNTSLFAGVAHYLFIGLFTYFYGINGALWSLIFSHIIKCYLVHIYLGKPTFLAEAFQITLGQIWSVLLILIMIGISFLYLNSDYKYFVYFAAISVSAFTTFNVYKTYNRIYLNKLRTQ